MREYEIYQIDEGHRVFLTLVAKLGYLPQHKAEFMGKAGQRLARHRGA